MNREVQKISVDTIIPNRFQPRKNFDEESLNELANSIIQHGIIQPLVLRKLGNSYEIIAGERRYKAAVKIGLQEVPAIVMELDDTSSAEIALVENIQRKDLTAIEEAKSYEKILELGQMNQEELAKRIGRNQSTVSNKLRLLNLSEEAQQALLDNKISERHARSLLRLKDVSKQNEMLNNIITNRLTVRETDNKIKEILGDNTIEPLIEDEILDFQSEDSIIKEPELTIPEIPVLQTTNETNSISDGENTNSNQVFINPDIVPPEQDFQPKPIIETTAIGGIPQRHIPEFDQVGINQSSIGNMEQSGNSTSSVGRFFNLDDESANMNMGSIVNPNNSIDVNQYIPNGVPNFDEHQINPQNNYNETVNQPVTEQNSDIQQQSIIPRQDITGAVAVIRNTIMNLQNNGYVIITNEQNSNESHQIIIEIKK